MKINFLGDMIFGDQSVIFGFGLDSMWYKQNYKDIFKGIADITQKSDYTVANFESIIKKRTNENQNIYDWSMCCDENICNELSKAKINIVSIANNHTMDFGKEGLEYTISQLKKSNINIIGLKECPFVIIECNNTKIAIIGASYLTVSNHEECMYLLNPSVDMWRQINEKLKYCDYKIAYVHWGSEFVIDPTERQINISKEIISMGIDLIVGHHPHIIQKKMMIEGSPVVFSLGNIVSDYWQKRLRYTEILNIDFSTNVSMELFPCKISSKGNPILIGESKQIVFDKTRKKPYINFNRLRMRVEYLTKLTLNFHKIKGKKEYISWIKSRVIYVIKYLRAEMKEPEIIYKLYERNPKNKDTDLYVQHFKFKDFLFLHLIILLNACSPVLTKYASLYSFFSLKYIFIFSCIIFILGIYAILWQQIIKKFKPSVAYSNKSIVLVWTALASVILFGERLTLNNIIGIVLIIIGVIFVVQSNE